MDADAAPQEITTLVGREVYSNNGVFVGEVEDVRLDLDSQAVTGLALSAVSDELFGSRIDPGKGVMIPYRWVRAVGDVILVNDTVERLKQENGDEEAVA
ncbi:PRC-barrel domain-containing protein [Halobaculum sp. CBA1158]|uniref:PRC-barrel domain-containing protein n=1 Tax=Halobaculum sp. CBA1158 TaxID=2904243 RepID=UPI001F299978|nr:PRC-barrel domain-containing protein [Halobaculum sp. CBA1158]UIO98802.1 PRC-barrel domain-containing protein [Halobaculum sp. CBA1158]